MLSTLSNTLTLLALIAGVSACPGPLPPPDSDDQADDEPLPDLPPPVDLPCGGADFMSDSYNCGSCGNECTLWYEGTDWEAGTCVEGVCGPQWPASCVGESIQANTCEEICSIGTGETCVANGCSGLTAMYFEVGFDGYCGPDSNGPDGTMTGPCDEQIPWMSDIETSREVMCCCGE